MKFLMLMIPRVYQPGTPTAERAGDDFVPPEEAMEKMGKFNEELAKARYRRDSFFQARDRGA